MQSMSWIIAGLFLPLFPMSMVFNVVFQRTKATWLRIILLVIWPLPGLWVVKHYSVELPDWILFWALFSAVLYGFRSAVIKELSVWTGFIATSSWSLIWVAIFIGAKDDDLLMHVMAFSVPLILLALLAARLERQYESAYAGVVKGLAQEQPKMTGLLVVVMLAVIGTPLFPSFFSLLSHISNTIIILPAVAFGLLLVWLLWSWSGIRLLQELLVGTPTIEQHEDMGQGMTIFYCSLLVMLVVAGVFMSEVLL